MKKLFILSSLMVAGLTDTFAQYNATVLKATKDLIVMRCTGYGKKAVAAATDAELSALRTLVFYGADGTTRCQPMIKEDKTSIETKFSKEFDDLYRNNYKDFISSSVIVTPFGKNSLKKKCITLDVAVRVNQLRSYLENKGIIRKFGL